MATDARELVRKWPALSGLGADARVLHPAWRMPALLGSRRGTLTASSDEMTDDVLRLELTLEDESHVLQLADSPLFPDLHLLWSRRKNLPPEIVMALVERECSEFFQFLEKTFRRQLGVRGQIDEGTAPTHVFRLALKEGILEFGLDLTPELLATLGQLDFLDSTHESIRSLTRKAWASYGTLILTAEECARLSPSSCIVPQGDLLAAATWTVDLPSDETVSVLSADPVQIPFSAFADESLPEIPAPSEVVLVCHGRIFAAAVATRLGEAFALKVTEVK